MTIEAPAPDAPFMEQIRHIATSFNGPVIALAEFEKRVQIFDINRLDTIAEFDTILSFGGRRLAIAANGEICICGCWARHGICAYDTTTGKLIWQRKDLKKVQRIQILQVDETKIFTSFERGASRIIDINTGADIDKISGARLLFNSKYAPVDIVDKSGKTQVVDRSTGKTKLSMQSQSFATLDIAFAENSVAISEVAGPLSCYSIHGFGKPLWRLPMDKDGHLSRISYNEQLNMFVGVSLTSSSKERPRKLKYINKDNGTIEKELAINRPIEAEFALNGQVLITSDREIINVETGEKKSWA
jgi:outer membrane protein assembly factor BamB